ncbi:MAG TPA: AAA family ATPase [Ignavibacteriales bacterium]|nr:AAA family ATPase [Ignavibacteriales bacterium]
MRRLPIGIQTFEEIRKDNYFYVDKTKEAYDLLTNYKYVFLSRPRRFGKSLFVDTLKCIFEGRKKLFEGLYIYDKRNWEEKYPVIHISWDGELNTISNIKKAFYDNLVLNQKRLKLDTEKDIETPSSYFRHLIIDTYEKYHKPVVILIDEYDKPLLDNIDKTEFAKEVWEFLSGLYSIIKGNLQYVKFVFITGISKFAKAGIFSGLNMLEDITLSPDFGNICGYRQEDVEELLKEYNANVDYDEVKEWYNGYYWLKDRLYNPFDLLRFIKNNYEYEDYWFSTGTPSFLIKLIEKNNYYLPQLSNLKIEKSSLEKYNVEKVNLNVLLFQSGYLTIKEVEYDEYEENQIYKLGFPNKEVRKSFNTHIIEQIYNDETLTNRKLNKAFHEFDLEKVEEILKSLFSSIPYNNYVNNTIFEYEGYYSSVIFVYLQAMGYEIIGEDVTNRGRIDLTLLHRKAIYLFEFKIEKGKDALEQLKAKNYHEKYMNDERPIYLVGINFDKEVKNICNFQYEKVK